MHRILIFNLGGTSTKLAVFDEETLVVEGTIRHTDREIQGDVYKRQALWIAAPRVGCPS